MKATPAARAQVLTYPQQDPPHLHLAAYALAYPILSGAMDFIEAASCLALAGIAAGLLDSKSDRHFEMLRDRLERSLVSATVEIERKDAERIRAAITAPIASGQPIERILLSARAANQPTAIERAIGRTFYPLPYQTLEEICRQEVRKALEAEAHGRTAHG